MIYLKRCTIIQWYTTVTWTWFIRFYWLLIGYFSLSSEWLKVLFILCTERHIERANSNESYRILILVIFTIGILLNRLATTTSSCNSSCMLTWTQWPCSYSDERFIPLGSLWLMVSGSLLAEMFQTKWIPSLHGRSNDVIVLMDVELFSLSWYRLLVLKILVYRLIHAHQGFTDRHFLAFVSDGPVSVYEFTFFIALNQIISAISERNTKWKWHSFVVFI